MNYFILKPNTSLSSGLIMTVVMSTATISRKIAGSVSAVSAVSAAARLDGPTITTLVTPS